MLLLEFYCIILGSLSGGKRDECNRKIREFYDEPSSRYLSEKKEGVIYIDNRTTEKDAEPKVFETGKTSAEEILQRVHESAAPSFAEEEVISAVKTEEPEPPRKYFSRDCCTSKTGKTYTIEELEEQIRE